MNKIRSYIGFAIKSRSILLGQSKIKYCKGEISLIMLSKDATDNLYNLANNVAERKNCPVIKLNVTLDELTNVDNIKIIAITNNDLANGIINEYSKI